MTELLCYVFLTSNGTLLIIQCYKCLIGPMPTKADAVQWILHRLNMFAFAAVWILSVILFIFDCQAISLTILSLSIALVLMAGSPSRWRELYNVSPPIEYIPRVRLSIKNTTDKKFHLKIECLFNLVPSGTTHSQTYLSYDIEPFETRNFTLSKNQSLLLTSKSRTITVLMHELIMESDGHGHTREIQKCFRLQNEVSSTFKSHHYKIVI